METVALPESVRKDNLYKSEKVFRRALRAPSQKDTPTPLSLIEEFGVVGALFIQDVYWFTRQGETEGQSKNGRKFVDGHWWTYQTEDEICARYRVCPRTWRKLHAKIKESGVLTEMQLKGAYFYRCTVTPTTSTHYGEAGERLIYINRALYLKYDGDAVKACLMSALLHAQTTNESREALNGIPAYEHKLSFLYDKVPWVSHKWVRRTLYSLASDDEILFYGEKTGKLGRKRRVFSVPVSELFSAERDLSELFAELAEQNAPLSRTNSIPTLNTKATGSFEYEILKKTRDLKHTDPESEQDATHPVPHPPNCATPPTADYQAVIAEVTEFQQNNTEENTMALKIAKKAPLVSKACQYTPDTSATHPSWQETAQIDGSVDAIKATIADALANSQAKHSARIEKKLARTDANYDLCDWLKNELCRNGYTLEAAGLDRYKIRSSAKSLAHQLVMPANYMREVFAKVIADWSIITETHLGWLKEKNAPAIQLLLSPNVWKCCCNYAEGIPFQQSTKASEASTAHAAKLQSEVERLTKMNAQFIQIAGYGDPGAAFNAKHEPKPEIQRPSLTDEDCHDVVIEMPADLQHNPFD